MQPLYISEFSFCVTQKMSNYREYFLSVFSYKFLAKFRTRPRYLSKLASSWCDNFFKVSSGLKIVSSVCFKLLKILSFSNIKTEHWGQSFFLPKISVWSHLSLCVLNLSITTVECLGELLSLLYCFSIFDKFS